MYSVIWFKKKKKEEKKDWNVQWLWGKQCEDEPGNASIIHRANQNWQQPLAKTPEDCVGANSPDIT